uniref:Cytochrome b-c1 complex subunit 7 n=1 Tax=Oryctolagus cuniculus TaxID=9986 RepID=A0A5F9CCK7_RABIT
IYKDAEVKETIRMFLEKLNNDRMIHFKIVLVLIMKHQVSSKEQRTKYEEYEFYLEPHLKEVIWERKERDRKFSY